VPAASAEEEPVVFDGLGDVEQVMRVLRLAAL
jgi:hypothetical protein